MPNVKSYFALMEGALSHFGARIEEDDVIVAPLACATVGVHLVKIRLREPLVSFLGVENFILRLYPKTARLSKTWAQAN